MVIKVLWNLLAIYFAASTSVLILIALGLAITFGIMGVINMALGELVMIGAYATYEVQMYFGHAQGLLSIIITSLHSRLPFLLRQ